MHSTAQQNAELCYDYAIMIEQLLAENEGKIIEFKYTTRSLGGIMKTVNDPSASYIAAKRSS